MRQASGKRVRLLGATMLVTNARATWHIGPAAPNQLYLQYSHAPVHTPLSSSIEFDTH